MQDESEWIGAECSLQRTPTARTEDLLTRKPWKKHPPSRGVCRHPASS